MKYWFDNVIFFFIVLFVYGFVVKKNNFCYEYFLFINFDVLIIKICCIRGNGKNVCKFIKVCCNSVNNLKWIVLLNRNFLGLIVI